MNEQRILVIEDDHDIANVLRMDLTDAGYVVDHADSAMNGLIKAREDHPDLVWFREHFVRRYEAQEVPLAEALDPETGIGFSPPRTVSASREGLDVPGAPRRGAPWEPRHAVLLEALRRAWAAGSVELSLRPEEVDALADEVAVLQHPLLTTVHLDFGFQPCQAIYHDQVR